MTDINTVIFDVDGVLNRRAGRSALGAGVKRG